jgi:hypothetical protein
MNEGPWGGVNKAPAILSPIGLIRRIAHCNNVIAWAILVYALLLLCDEAAHNRPPWAILHGLFLAWFIGLRHRFRLGDD